MIFYLGTHEPSWLNWLDIPLFISRRRLARCQTMPRALGAWALDSGGFSEIALHGRWTTPWWCYVNEVRRYEETIGSLVWAAPQDWMCEPDMLAKTGLSVREHQARTLENFLLLRERLGSLVVPVLQGWRLEDYLAHLEAYHAAGVNLTQERVVGVGSVCRRQATEEALSIFRTLHAQGLRLHGFGVKSEGLLRAAPHLASADSMAWSLNARKQAPLPGCSHQSCANCDRWALRWRGKLLQRLVA